MAKYFSSKKTSTNGFSFNELASLFVDLEGAEELIGTKEYKSFLRQVAILVSDKTKPCYLDLSTFRDDVNQCWNNKLMTAKELITDVKKDIYLFMNERVQSKNL